jgi:hypothetical protein
MLRFARREHAKCGLGDCGVLAAFASYVRVVVKDQAAPYKSSFSGEKCQDKAGENYRNDFRLSYANDAKCTNFGALLLPKKFEIHTICTKPHCKRSGLFSRFGLLAGKTVRLKIAVALVR